MRTRKNCVCLMLAVCFGGLNSVVLSQEKDAVDRIILKNGTELQGRILEEKKENGRQVLVVKLKSGGTMSLDSAKLVSKVRKYDEVDAKYERALLTAGKDPAAYWKLYEWTEKEVPNGKVRFKLERKFLLEKIVELSPDDKNARHRLGYQKKDGQWILEDAYYVSRGYHKVEGRTWQSNLESEMAEKSEAGELQQKQKKAELGLWKKRAERRDANFETARAELLKMADEALAVHLLNEIRIDQKEKKLDPLRGLYLEVFGEVPCTASVLALSHFAVEEEDVNLRDRALTLLLQPGFDRNMAAAIMSGHLENEKETKLEYLERAAHVIGELNAQNQIVSLINVLETKRKHVENPGAQNQPPGATGINTTMTQNGAGGLSIPASSPTVTNKPYFSGGALASLKKMTKVDFGYDEAAWKRWYIENYSLHDSQVRTDD